MKLFTLCTSAALLLLPTTLLAEDKNPAAPPQNQKPKGVRQKIRVQVQPKGGPAVVQIQQLRPAAFAGGYAAPNKLYLLRRTDVQKELKLDEDQQKEIQEAIQELNKKRREAFAKLRQGANNPNRAKDYQKLNREINAEAERKIGEILKPEQVQRLNEIAVQLQGIRALQNPEIAKKLKLTEEQQNKIARIRSEGFQELRKVFQDVRNGNLDRTKVQQKVQELNARTEKKCLEVLTKEQQAQFEKMKGKKFESNNQGRAIRAAPGQIRIQINGKKIKNIQIRRIPVQPKPVQPKPVQPEKAGQ